MLRLGDRFEAEVYKIRELTSTPVQNDFRIVTLNIDIPGRVQTYFATLSWSLEKLGRESQIGDEVMVEYGPPHPYDSQPKGRLHIVHLTGESVGATSVGTVSWEPNHQAVYCRVQIDREDGLPLSIKATFSGFDRKRLKKGTRVEVVRSDKNDARRYHIVRILDDDKSICVPLEDNMKVDRVKFFLGCRYYNTSDSREKIKRVLYNAFRMAFHESDNLMRSKADGFALSCRADQFAKFMIYRNREGVTNGFIDLQAELLEPESEVDVYTRIALTAGVDRCDVKKVLLALDYSGSDVEQRLNKRQVEVDVSDR